MTDGAPAPAPEWPPIIRTSKVGRTVLVRDWLLTLLMWFILFLILYTELRFAFEALQVLLGRSDAEIDAEMALFWRKMEPLLWIVGALVLLLGLATLASIRRRNRALWQPVPPPLPDAAIATLAGWDQAVLAAARRARRTVVRRVEGTGLVVTEGLPADNPAMDS